MKKSHFDISILSSVSLVTTDSTTSEDEPPPLPAKTRDSNDYSNLPLSPTNVNHQDNIGNGNYSIIGKGWTERKKPMPAPYDQLDPKKIYENRRQRPPTPPPKPSRGSKSIPA